MSIYSASLKETKELTKAWGAFNWLYTCGKTIWKDTIIQQKYSSGHTSSKILISYVKTHDINAKIFFQLAQYAQTTIRSMCSQYRS